MLLRRPLVAGCSTGYTGNKSSWKGGGKGAIIDIVPMQWESWESLGGIFGDAMWLESGEFQGNASIGLTRTSLMH